MYRTIISARAPSIISLLMSFRMQASCCNNNDFGERPRAKKEKWVIVFDVNYSSVKCQSIVVHFAIGNLCSIVPARVEMEQVRAPNDLQKPSSKLITPRTCIFTSFPSSSFSCCWQKKLSSFTFCISMRKKSARTWQHNDICINL